MGREIRIYYCYGILKNIVWIWRVLGIFPYDLEGWMTTKKYVINKFFVGYSLVLCFVCIINFCHGLIQYHMFRQLTSIAPMTILLRTSTAVLSMIISILGRNYCHKALTTSFEAISTQGIILDKMGCYRFTDYVSSAKIIFIYVWTSFIIASLLRAYDFYASYDFFIGNFSRIVQWIFWSVPLIIQCMDLTIFVSLVALLGFKFRALNEKIKTIAIRVNSSSPKVIVTSNVCADNLRSVAKVHYNICAIGKRINNLFSLAIIVNVVTGFVILSNTLYYIFVEFQREDKTDYIRIGMYLHWELIHSIPIITIVAVCNWTSHQSLHAGELIHEIRVEITDFRLFEDLKSFSLQLHHQKLEFSAGGFFPVNSTLLQSILGNITTFLVILVQFQPKLD